MPALDTNVLIRYLIADDREQFRLAKAFIDRAVSNEKLFIPLSVVVELEWVLRSLYGLNKPMLLETFNRLLETSELEFQEEPSIEIALSLYADNTADFADCLHVASTWQRDRIPFMTFDRNASKITGAQLLG